ncbi:MAG: Arc family DNA-binding protein [Chloroflexi bacterium]|nr:Arc family DNA-binding protein [Chloroflexota bacterium]MBI4198364.1 Arc family DNA-binding protein [Chloroflexota bacterium]
MSLSIKNVPDELAQKLRERAKRNHRSLQGELLAMLEEGAEKLTVEEVSEWVKASGLKTASNSVEIIREDRDTDHGRLPHKVTVNELYEHGKKRGLKTASDSVEILRELRDGRNRS